MPTLKYQYQILIILQIKNQLCLKSNSLIISKKLQIVKNTSTISPKLCIKNYLALAMAYWKLCVYRTLSSLHNRRLFSHTQWPNKICIKTTKKNILFIVFRCHPLTSFCRFIYICQNRNKISLAQTYFGLQNCHWD